MLLLYEVYSMDNILLANVVIVRLIREKISLNNAIPNTIFYDVQMTNKRVERSHDFYIFVL